MAIDEKELERLIEPVCAIAALQPDNSWPNDLKTFVAYARKVKKHFGFAVQLIQIPQRD